MRSTSAFARSTGEILGYLNTDDTLYCRLPAPGRARRSIRRVAGASCSAAAYSRGRLVLCRLEHPAEYRGRFEMLAVWKARLQYDPQPSTFWHRKVYETCAGLRRGRRQCRARLQAVVPFLEAIRVSRGRRGVVDLPDAPVSVTSNQTEQERLRRDGGLQPLPVGPVVASTALALHNSYWLHDRDLAEQARARARRAEGAARAGRYAQAAVEILRMSVRSPRMTAYWASQLLASRAPWVARRARAQREDAFTGRYSDNWIGPMYKSDVSVPADARRLVVTLEHHPNGHHRLVTPALCLNGKVVDWRQHEAGRLALAGDLSDYRGRSCEIEIRTPEFFVPRFVNGSPDDRELSVCCSSISGSRASRKR